MGVPIGPDAVASGAVVLLSSARAARNCGSVLILGNKFEKSTDVAKVWPFSF